MASLSPMAVDTITTRFLILFLFLLAIPLGTLIIFTVSLLGSHLESTTQSQMSLSRNLFEGSLIDAGDTLDLLSRQMRERVQEGKTDCLRTHHLLCLTVDHARNTIILSNGAQKPLSGFQRLNPDLEASYGQVLGGKHFLARLNGKLYLFRKDDPTSQGTEERLYGFPLDDSLLNRIYQRQTGLQTEIWLLAEEQGQRNLNWLARRGGISNQAAVKGLLDVLQKVSPEQKAGFVADLPQGSYQISQENLYSLDNRKIARVVHIFPLAQGRLLLNNYYLGLYMIVVASLMFSVLLAMAAGRTITQPLLRLVNQVNMLSRENVMKEGDKVPVSGVLEIRQLGEAFNRMILRLRQEHKMKDEFVATLTHDLKVPLLAEKQTLSYFLSETYGTLNEEQKEILDILKSTNRSCLSLVNGLLEVYRYDSGEVSLVFEAFNLASLLDDTVVELKSLAREKSIDIQVKCEAGGDEGLLVYADPLEIKRVLHNLISNAIINTPVHGKIECRLTDTANYGSETVYKVSSFQHTTLKYPVNLADRLLVVIQDSGIGFSNDDLSHLFKQFAASKGRNPMSIGLGLYNCHQVLRAHHNALWVESTEGEGSAVSFTLAMNKQTAQDRRVFRDRRRLP